MRGRLLESDLRIGFRLGKWEVRPIDGTILGPDGSCHLEPKVMDVLVCLAANADNVTERDTLFDQVWGKSAVSDETLTRCIASLRKALGDDPQSPTYIQTVPKRGYRLVASVAIDSDKARDKNLSDSPTAKRQDRVGLLAIIGLIAAIAAIFVYGWIRFAPSQDPQLDLQASVVDRDSVLSIAVLPFANLSPETESEYLSDGLATELTDILTTIPDFKVAARTSAFAFKGRDFDVTDIASQLRVNHILTGSVQQSGERLRVTAQLVDAKDGYQIWSNSWERRLTDIIDIQDEITAAVIESLQLQLLQTMSATQRADPEAYAYYLKGKIALIEDNEPDVGEREPERRHTRALSLTMHALAIDPNYAPAWGQLAEVQFNQAQWKSSDQAEAYARAAASAHRALELDPNQVVALSALGSVFDGWHWDAETAAGLYKRALTAAPGNAGTLNAISLLYGRLGRANIAHRYLLAAYDRDPFNKKLAINLALSYWNQGEFAAAREQLEQARQIAPNALRVQVFDALFAYLEGDFEQAALQSDRLNEPLFVCSLIKMERLGEALAELEKLRSSDPLDAFSIAVVYACRNDKDNAFAWLQRAYEDHSPRLRWMRTNARLGILHDDPRWEELLQKVGVSDDHAKTVSEELGNLGL